MNELGGVVLGTKNHPSAPNGLLAKLRINQVERHDYVVAFCKMYHRIAFIWVS